MKDNCLSSQNRRLFTYKSWLPFGFVATVLALISLGATEAQAQRTWISNSNSSYAGGANWDPSGGAPTSADDLLFNNNGAQNTINLANGARVGRNVEYARTSDNITIHAGNALNNSLTWNSLTMNSGTTTLIVRSQSPGTDPDGGPLAFSILTNLALSSHLQLGNPTSATADRPSSIFSVSVGGTTTLHSGGQLSLSRAESTVNLGSLAMSGGTLNLTTGAGTNGSSTTVENVITVNRLNGETGFIQANKDSTQGHLIVNGTVDGNFGGVIRNNATGAVVRLTKDGNSTLTLSGNNTYSGTTTVVNGMLVGDHNSAFGTGAVLANGGVTRIASTRTISNAVTINGGELNVRGVASGAITFGASGGTLSGNGTISQAVTLNNLNQVLAPGNSPGILTLDISQAWESFSYEWELNSWTDSPVAGTDYDQIAITGTVDFSLASANSISLQLISLTAANEAGDVPGFAEVDRQWTILTSTAGITGFHASHWDIDTTGFTSSPNWAGTWSVAQIGNSVVLTYSAIPEPGTGLLFLLAGGTWALLRRRPSSMTSA